MQEQDQMVSKRSQSIALGMIFLAVIIAVSGYFYANATKKKDCPVNDIEVKIGSAMKKGRISTSVGRTGAGIASVAAGSAAAKAGLKADDTVIEANGRATACPKDLREVLNTWPDQTVNLTVLRGKEKVELVLVGKSSAKQKSSPTSALNGTSCPVTSLSNKLEAEINKGGATAVAGSGVGINSVVPGGPAERAGIKGGDIILSIDGTTTSCPKTLLGALSDWPGKSRKLVVERGGSQVDLTLPEK